MQLEEAMGPLFRAATALGPEAAAQSSASRTHMGELLQWLLPDATATTEMGDPLVSTNNPFADAREHYDTFLPGWEAFGARPAGEEEQLLHVEPPHLQATVEHQCLHAGGAAAVL